MTSKKEPKAYDWDYDGSCAPTPSLSRCTQLTFSVGVFQWLPKSSRKGLKRGKVVRRISGYTSDPEPVYTEARAECARRTQLYAAQQRKASTEVNQ